MQPLPQPQRASGRLTSSRRTSALSNYDSLRVLTRSDKEVAGAEEASCIGGGGVYLHPTVFRCGANALVFLNSLLLNGSIAYHMEAEDRAAEDAPLPNIRLDTTSAFPTLSEESAKGMSIVSKCLLAPVPHLVSFDVKVTPGVLLTPLECDQEEQNWVREAMNSPDTNDFERVSSSTVAPPAICLCQPPLSEEAAKGVAEWATQYDVALAVEHHLRFSRTVAPVRLHACKMADGRVSSPIITTSPSAAVTSPSSPVAPSPLPQKPTRVHHHRTMSEAMMSSSSSYTTTVTEQMMGGGDGSGKHRSPFLAGLEIAVGSMRVGESAVFVVAPQSTFEQALAAPEQNGVGDVSPPAEPIPPSRAATPPVLAASSLFEHLQALVRHGTTAPLFFSIRLRDRVPLLRPVARTSFIQHFILNTAFHVTAAPPAAKTPLTTTHLLSRRKSSVGTAGPVQDINPFLFFTHSNLCRTHQHCTATLWASPAVKGRLWSPDMKDVSLSISLLTALLCELGSLVEHDSRVSSTFSSTEWNNSPPALYAFHSHQLHAAILQQVPYGESGLPVRMASFSSSSLSDEQRQQKHATLFHCFVHLYSSLPHLHGDPLAYDLATVNPLTRTLCEYPRPTVVVPTSPCSSASSPESMSSSHFGAGDIRSPTNPTEAGGDVSDAIAFGSVMIPSWLDIALHTSPFHTTNRILLHRHQNGQDDRIFFATLLHELRTTSLVTLQQAARAMKMYDETSPTTTTTTTCSSEATDSLSSWFYATYQSDHSAASALQHMNKLENDDHRQQYSNFYPRYRLTIQRTSQGSARLTGVHDSPSEATGYYQNRVMELLLRYRRSGEYSFRLTVSPAASPRTFDRRLSLQDLEATRCPRNHRDPEGSELIATRRLGSLGGYLRFTKETEIFFWVNPQYCLEQVTAMVEDCAAMLMYYSHSKRRLVAKGTRTRELPPQAFPPLEAERMEERLAELVENPLAGLARYREWLYGYPKAEATRFEPSSTTYSLSSLPMLEHMADTCYSYPQSFTLSPTECQHNLLHRLLCKVVQRCFHCIFLMTCNVNEDLAVPQFPEGDGAASLLPWALRGLTPPHRDSQASASRSDVGAGDGSGAFDAALRRTNLTPPSFYVKDPSEETSSSDCLKRYELLGISFALVAITMEELSGVFLSMHMYDFATSALAYLPHHSSLWWLRARACVRLGREPYALRDLEMAKELSGEAIAKAATLLQPNRTATSAATASPLSIQQQHREAMLTRQMTKLKAWLRTAHRHSA